MEVSPFPYHGPLRAGQVRGREDLTADLVNRISSNRVTALVGPRRFGKTSLLRQASDLLAGSNGFSVWVDLYGLESLHDLADRLKNSLSRTRGPLLRSIRKISENLSLEIRLPADTSLLINKGSLEPANHCRYLLEVLVRTARRQPGTFVIFDEFSSIDRVANADALVRTSLQHHFQDLGIAFGGSEPSTMEMLFSLPSKPFYEQADILRVGSLDSDTMYELLENGFEDLDGQRDDAFDSLVSFSRGHPQRFMMLADRLWRLSGAGGITHETWDSALSSVREDLADGFSRSYDSLSGGARKLLRLTSCGEKAYGRAAADLGLAPGEVSNARKSLTADGSLWKVKDEFAVVDPLFEDWVRRRFCGEVGS